MTLFSAKMAGFVLGAVLVVGGAAIAMPAQAASLTSAQVSAIILLLQAFGVDGATIARVQASLQGQMVVPPQVGCGTYAHLKRGDTDWSTGGGAVTLLQRFLGIYPTTGYYGPITQGLWNTKCGSVVYAHFSATPTYGVAPLEVTFGGNANAGCDGGNFIISYGDGSSDQVAIPADSCNSNFSQKHTYRFAGTYTATLSPYIACLYSNPRCLMAEPAPIGTVTITVTGDTGTTNTTFSASPTAGARPLTVTFSNWSTGGPWLASEYPQIDFGDGSAVESAGKCNDPADRCDSPGINTHTYTSAGTYTAKLTKGGNCYREAQPYCPPPQVIGTVTITVRI